jgi:hypothetical protein
MRKGVANGVFIVPPREFVVPSEWYYTEQGVGNGKFEKINYGITSVQIFINIRPTVLLF